MINILMATDFGWGPSISSSFEEITKRLDKRMFRVYSFQTKDKIKNYPINMTPIKIMMPEKWNPYLRNIVFNVTLPKILATPIDIIQTHGAIFATPLSYSCKLFHPRLKHIFHTTLPHTKQQQLMIKPLCSNADVVVSVSRFVADGIKKFFGVESRVIYNSVDTKLFKPRDHYNDRLKILFVGRLIEIKRPEYIVKLARDFPQCDFSIYGEGHLKPKLISWSKDIKNIKINSPIPHEKLVDIYSTSDIFVFPSIFEGFATVILEAAASGLPIICSNAASLPEFVGHGKEGLLCNNYKEFKDNLSYLIKNEKIRKKYSNNARKKSLNYDWDITTKRYSDLYEEVMK